MPVMKLQRRTLSAIPKVSVPTIFFDESLKGFGLRVWPSGVRRWVVEYRPRGGGRKTSKTRMLIGSIEQFDPDEARAEARRILARVLLGENPMADRREQRAAETISELERLYTEACSPGRKPRTLALYEVYWRLHILPEIGNRKAKDVTEADIARLHRRISEGKTGPRAGTVKAKPQPATANRAIKLIRNFYGWAARAKVVPKGFDPAEEVALNKETARERFLSGDEFGRLGAAIREAETVGIPWAPQDVTKAKAKHAPKRPEVRLSRICPYTAGAIRLLIFTGARLREILNLRWSEVDLERGVLFLGDSKTGRKTIVLNALGLQILADLDKIGPYVFPGDNLHKPRADLKRPWQLITRRAGLDGLRIHDLRHSFASFGAGAQLGLPIIGGLLGHADPKTTARYAHLANDPLRAATNTIGTKIQKAMNGEIR
jgi:integrase